MFAYVRAGALALAFASVIDASANTLTVSIADYNASQLSNAGGAVTVPASFATYNVTTANLVVEIGRAHV